MSNSHPSYGLLESLVENIRDGMVVASKQQVLFANQAARELLGPVGGQVMKSALSSLSGAAVDRFETVLCNSQGQWVPVDWQRLEIDWSEQPAQLFILHDISARRSAEQQRRLLQRSIEASPNGMVIVDALAEDLPIRYVNPAFCRITGYTPEEVVGRNCRFLQGDERQQPERLLVRQAINNQQEVRVTLRNFRKDGTAFWNELVISPVPDERGKVTHFVSTQHDISMQLHAEQALAYNVSHDVLTSLPNLSLLRDRLTQALNISRRHNSQVALTVVNLDGFKAINSSLGLAAGDSLLIQVADRLLELMQAGDTLARLSADEFALLQPNVMAEDDVTGLVDELIVELALPYRPVPGGDPVYLTASAGIALSSAATKDASDLLRHASLAVRQAKGRGGDCYHWYTEIMNQRANRLVTLRKDIQDALDNNAFELYYQPIIDSSTGQCRSVEALLRWQHPQEGWLSPGEFLPIAESTGQMVPLGEWVLRRACMDARQLLDQGRTDHRVAVNISAAQFLRSDAAHSVAKALADSGLPARALELEIVESVVMGEDGERVREALLAIRAMGVGIVIDDFGAGGSGFSCLKQIPVTRIKIDPSFIRHIISDQNDAAITRGLIDMVHKLSMEVVAQGVEDEYQAAYLIRHKCDQLQGYFLGRPMGFEALSSFELQQDCARLFARAEKSGQEPSRTLLILDDEANILRSLQRLLRRDGYQILATTSASEAFKLLSSHRVQVVLSDQRMPEMNGTEFFSRVKQLHPGTVRIILSGYTDLDSVTDAINRGAIYKFLTKPWDDDQIREEVKQAFIYHAASDSEENGG
ncbi:MAG: EAL domain-containing protein [Halomonadaceae bacterium]|nr:MAG: EAL domain-containing protein [Halomonadaceae bacterium]